MAGEDIKLTKLAKCAGCGAKVADKIGVITNLLNKCDTLLIGGGMAYTFFKAMGNQIGTSICESDKLDLARDIMAKAHEKGVNFLLPVDNIIGREYKEDTTFMRIYSDSIPDGWMGLDIGEKTQELFSKTITGAGTVVWNGPMGVSEWENFASGNRRRTAYRLPVNQARRRYHRHNSAGSRFNDRRQGCTHG